MKLLFSPLFIRVAFIGLPILIAVGCKKDDDAPPPTAPAVSTMPLTKYYHQQRYNGRHHFNQWQRYHYPKRYCVEQNKCDANTY
jgi:hypothetical protein